jgi:hypothetical protein
MYVGRCEARQAGARLLRAWAALSYRHLLYARTIHGVLVWGDGFGGCVGEEAGDGGNLGHDGSLLGVASHARCISLCRPCVYVCVINVVNLSVLPIIGRLQVQTWRHFTITLPLACTS